MWSLEESRKLLETDHENKAMPMFDDRKKESLERNNQKRGIRSVARNGD